MNRLFVSKGKKGLRLTALQLGSQCLRFRVFMQAESLQDRNLFSAHFPSLPSLLEPTYCFSSSSPTRHVWKLLRQTNEKHEVSSEGILTGKKCFTFDNWHECKGKSTTPANEKRNPQSSCICSITGFLLCPVWLLYKNCKNEVHTGGKWNVRTHKYVSSKLLYFPEFFFYINTWQQWEPFLYNIVSSLY